VVTLAAGVLVSPMFFVLHLVADFALGGFVLMLVSHRNRTMQARSRVVRRDGFEATPLTRRRASGS
jgi:hypothetical protein